MNDALVQVLLVALFALSCGALSLAWMQRRLGLAAAILFGVALAVWVRRLRRDRRGRRRRGRLRRLTEECSGVHYSVVVGFLAPPLLIALASFAGIVALEQRRRARRAQ